MKAVVSSKLCKSRCSGKPRINIDSFKCLEQLGYVANERQKVVKNPNSHDDSKHKKSIKYRLANSVTKQ